MSATHHHADIATTLDLTVADAARLGVQPLVGIGWGRGDGLTVAYATVDGVEHETHDEPADPEALERAVAYARRDPAGYALGMVEAGQRRDADVKPKSREEIESLKAGWLKDPVWDVEGTEGFEAHVDELTAFATAKRREWNLRAQRREREEHDAKAARASTFGCSVALLDYIERLEDRIERLEEAERAAQEEADRQDEFDSIKRRGRYAA